MVFLNGSSFSDTVNWKSGNYYKLWQIQIDLSGVTQWGIF